MVITNLELRTTFLSPEMRHYFRKKLPEVSPREVQMRIEECLKFLNMATHLNGNIPITQEIDDIWHYWILETEDYQRLCRKLTGRRFIHHRSNDYAESLKDGIKKNPLEWEVAALAAYVANYGPFKPERVRYWRLADHLVSKRGWSVQQLNDWLLSMS